MSAAVPWAVLIPLVGAALTLLLGRRYIAAIGVLSAVCTSTVVAGVGWLVWRDGPQRYHVGGWGAPLGIDLAIDGLSVVMLAMTAGVGVFVSWYAWGYFAPASPQLPGDGDERNEEPRRWVESDSFWPLWLFLWAALNIVFVSSDVFNIYVGLEIMGLAAVALVILAREPIALVAGLRYLLAALIGSLTWLMGVAVLYAAFGTLDIQLLGERLDSGMPAWTALMLMTVGLTLKTALFPLHFWLPAAHASAPAPVSAILSALVIKASFYLILRMWIDVFPEALTPGAGQLVGVVASAAILWGSIQAIRQTRIKLLVAYSTVAQIGYLFIMIPLMLPDTASVGNLAEWNPSAWEGGIYQILSHAFAKAAMFMAAGSIVYALGTTDRIKEMAGVATRLPVTTFTFGLASVSLMGLPPSGGFAAKWLLLTASIQNGQWWWAAVLIAGGLLTAVYVFKVLGQAFRPAVGEGPLRRVPLALELPGLALATAAFLMGLTATFVFDLLEIGLGPLS
jgi:multicomponent Na+:H+ antiporter subunit D